MPRMVCNDVEVEPVLEGAHWGDVWIYTPEAFGRDRDLHSNIDSFRDLTPKQIYKKHEN